MFEFLAFLAVAVAAILLLEWYIRYTDRKHFKEAAIEAYLEIISKDMIPVKIEEKVLPIVPTESVRDYTAPSPTLLR